MPSLRNIFVTLTAAVACVSSAVAAPSTFNHGASLIPRGAVFDERCDCYQLPLPVVIDESTSKITPLVEKLKSLDASAVTSANIKPITDEIKSVLTEGIGHLDLLAKGNAEVSLILSTGNGTLSISDCATLLAGLVNLILGSLGVVVKVVASGDSKDIILVLQDLVATLSVFINLSVSLVVSDGGLLAALVPLIKESLGVVVTLGLTSYYGFLGLDIVKTATELGVEFGVGIGISVVTEASTSLLAIIKTTFQTIQPLAEQLKGLTASSCNASTVGPIVAEIRAVLVIAVSQISTLVGKGLTAETLFLLDGKVLTVNDCAGIVGELVIALADGICETIKIVPATEAKAVIGLFVDIGLVVGQLINLCITIVTFDGGLLAPLTPIIKDTFGLVITLGLTDFYGFLNVDWTHIGVTIGVTVGGGVVGSGGVTTIVGAGTTVVSTIAATVTGIVSTGNNNNGNGGNADNGFTSVFASTYLTGTTVNTGFVSTPTGGSQNGGDDGDDLEDCDDEDDGTVTVTNGGQGDVYTTSRAATTSASVTNGGQGDAFTTSGAVTTSAAITNGGYGDVFTTSSAAATTATAGLSSSGVSTIATATTSGAIASSTCAVGANGQVSISLVAVVQELSVKITPLVVKLKALGASDCNKDTVGGIVAEIKGIFVAAIAQIKVLVGASVNVVLAKECGSSTVISVTEFAGIFGTLINLVFGAITIVLKTASGSGDYQALISIFADLGVVIGQFIQVTCSIVTFDGGLIVVLLPIIQASLSICVTLGIKTTFDFLNIDWTKIVVDLGVGVGVVSVVSIVNNCTTVVTPLIEKLKNLSPSDCTAANIQPIVIEIKSAFTVCIEQIKLLVGLSVDVVLASGGSVISVGDCGKLIGDLVNLVFGVCGTVLKTTVSGDYKVVIGLFADLGICIGEFIKVTTTVVTFDGGLIAVLTPLIQTSLGLCVTLGIKTTFDFLNIDWTKIGVSVGVGATVSIVTILNNCTTTITPLVQKLKDLTAEECTADNIGPIVVEIKSVLSFCIEQIKVLVGASVEVVLASGTGAVISVGECATIVGALVKLVLDTCGGVLKICVEAELKAVISIFAELCVLVGTLTHTCISVVTFDGGLLVALVPIIKTSLGVCLQLDITTAFDFLQIDFKQLAIDLGITIGAGVSVSLQTIIVDLTTQITPLVEQLKGLKAGDCGADKVGPIIGQIKTIIVAATVQVKALVGVQVSIDEITASVCGVLTLVFGALDVVLKVVARAHAKAVFGLCAELGTCLGLFVQAVCSVVVGLEASLLALVQTTLKASFGVVIKLAITGSFSFLNIDFDGLCGELGLNIGGILNALLRR